uniref:Uncharacterized protein n=1 Tax=Arundo donax TaxID=35708 RepID=A0A0A9DFH0_ARUDO
MFHLSLALQHLPIIPASSPKNCFSYTIVWSTEIRPCKFRSLQSQIQDA